MSVDTSKATGPLREVRTRLGGATDKVGDRLAEFWDDLAVRRRFLDAVDTVNDARRGLLRRVRGEPATTPLQEMTLDELHHLAAEREISGRSSMNKAELIDSLRKG